MKNPKWHRDEIILALDLYFDRDRGPIEKSNPKVIALSKLLRKLPLFRTRPNKRTFRNANGVALKLSNFRAIDPTHKGKGMRRHSSLDKMIFKEFSSNIPLLREISASIKKANASPKIVKEVYKIKSDELDENSSVLEGGILYKLHKKRERNRRVVELKKQQVLEEKGSLKCEACGFSFSKFYGSLGDGFIECHHLVPLFNYKASKRTALDDLALLCANCHRMIHRDLGINTIKEFRAAWKKK